MKQITACTYDCPDACSLVFEQGEDGGLRLTGNPDSPFTRGVMCAKTRRQLRRLRSPNRIVKPRFKTKGGWQDIGWEAALDLCAEKIQRLLSEPTAILHLHSDGAKGVLKEAVNLFFAQLGSSRIMGSLCDAAGYIAGVEDFGSRENNDIEDLANAAAIVNWGKDFSRSSIHTAAVVHRARRRGARVLTISPGGDGNDPFSDGRIRIRPGTDRFLAAAVIRRLIAEGRVPEAVLAHTRHPEKFLELIQGRSTEELLAVCEVSLSDAERPLPCLRHGQTPGHLHRCRPAALPLRRRERALHQRPGAAVRQRRPVRRGRLFPPALLPQPRPRLDQGPGSQGPAGLSHRRHRPGDPGGPGPAGPDALGQRHQCRQPGTRCVGNRPRLRRRGVQGGGGRLHERHGRAGRPAAALCAHARAAGRRRAPFCTNTFSTSLPWWSRRRRSAPTCGS